MPEATSPAGAPDAPSDVEGWGAALAHLGELIEQVGPDAPEDVVEQMRTWTPPQGLGPLPPGLAEWVQALQDQAEERATQLREAMATNRSQARVANSVPAARQADTSAYLDVSA